MPVKTSLRGWSLSAPPLAIIAVFIGVPIVFGVAYTLGYTGSPNDVIAMIALHQYTNPDGSPTIAAYQDVFSTPQFWASLGVTVLVTLVATGVIVVLAWLLSLYQRFVGGRFIKAVVSLAVIPMFIPVVIGSYGILSFYGSTGFFRSAAAALGWEDAPAFDYTTTGVMLGTVWVNLPFAVLLITSGLQGVPQSLVDAARDVGASPVRRFFSVLLPLTAVPTIISATFTAITVLGSFTIPYVIGPTAPNLLGVLMDKTYSASNRPQQAEVMAVVIFVLAAFASVPYLWANYRSAKNAGSFK